MGKIIITGLVAGAVLLLISVIGLYTITLIFPEATLQYVDSAFDTESHKRIVYYLHPFVISLALSWFWVRFRSVLRGTFFTRGIEFGLIYSLVATFPMMWLIYSALNISLAMVVTWFILALIQGIIAGLVLEKMNP